MKAYSDRTRKVVIASLLGPLAVIPAMVVAVAVMYMFDVSSQEPVSEIFEGTFVMAAFSLFYSYPLVIIYGLPLYLILRRYKKDSLIYILSLSLLPAAALGASYDTGGFWIFVIFGYFSLSVALSCWMLAH